ncbi:hypothetical protein EMGBS4_18940 [Acidimicrobiaceae bacterium]|nr:hypothetical protein EMGBS4_18940 [Acidimicrobiaceae bacterium]
MFATFKFQRFNLTRINLHQRLALWLIALLLLTKFSPVVALSTVLIVSLQVLFGDAIIARFSGFKQISCLSRVGLGFCVGATISTFAYVFVVTFTSVLVAVISQIICLLAHFCRELNRQVHLVRKRRAKSSRQSSGLHRCLDGVISQLVWTLPVAIWLAASFLVWSRLNKSSIALKLLVVMLSVFSGLFVGCELSPHVQIALGLLTTDLANSSVSVLASGYVSQSDDGLRKHFVSLVFVRVDRGDFEFGAHQG